MVLEDYAYTYNGANWLSTETDNGGAPTTYLYDLDGQLTGVIGTGAATYSYDGAGDRTDPGYSTGTGNQVTSDGTNSYTYDAEGNRLTKVNGTDITTYSYDNNNHLIGVIETVGGTLTAQATYLYDVFGNRIEEDDYAGGVTTITRFGYDGDNVWADVDGSNALQTRYVRPDGTDALAARVTASSSAVAWYLTDRQGSVRALTDNSGVVQDQLTYSGYGVLLTESDPSFGDRYKYTGREWDGVTGLQYNRARYYDPSTGSWVSEDPKGFGAGDDNLYRYVHDGPTDGSDPTGLFDPDAVWRMLQERDPVAYYLVSENHAVIGALTAGLTYAFRSSQTWFWESVDRGKYTERIPHFRINVGYSDEEALNYVIQVAKRDLTINDVGYYGLTAEIVARLRGEPVQAAAAPTNSFEAGLQANQAAAQSQGPLTAADPVLYNYGGSSNGVLMAMMGGSPDNLMQKQFRYERGVQQAKELVAAGVGAALLYTGVGALPLLAETAGGFGFGVGVTGAAISADYSLASARNVVGNGNVRPIGSNLIGGGLSQSGMDLSKAQTAGDVSYATLAAATGLTEAGISLKAAANAPNAARGGIQYGTAGDAFLTNASRATPVNGVLDVAVHGTPMTVEIGANTVNHRVLAGLIERNPQFTGQPIRLLSCETGNLPQGFAQNLANKLGVPVSAPNDIIWAWPNGALSIGPTPAANTGAWKLFRPGGGRP
jgi:RHS repeat-associated protein